MPKRQFIRKIEDFTCEVCETTVKGTGYTDHCPKCLWSKHVDIFPGDRKAECGGLMEPVGAIHKKGEWDIFYRCRRCGYERLNKASPDNNFEKIIELSTHPIKPRRSKRSRK